MKNIYYFIRGVIALILVIANLFVIPAMMVILGGIRFLTPGKRLKLIPEKGMQTLTTFWNRINSFIVRWVTAGKWQVDIDPNIELSKKKSYLVLCNHRSWLDILTLNAVLGGKIPVLKFFLKKQLVWQLPVAGLACKAAGYPFMERATPKQIKKNPALKRRDIILTQQACSRFKLMPNSPTVFVEGTRFSEQKRLNKKSPYQHLLKPALGSIAILLAEMEQDLAGIIDVTLLYQPTNVSMLGFLFGQFDTFKAKVNLLPIEPDWIGDFETDRAYRKQAQQKLNALWQQKDQTIHHWLEQHDTN